jgi:ABC-type dipeptide/oligopeptide/nickel transport system ATPase component
MKAGKIVEQGDVEQVMNHPKSTYTQALIAAIPRPPNAI